MGIRGAVATPHLSATRAGEHALAEGGSAVDAAIAAAAVLAVVAPDQCGLGGDAVALVGHGAGDVTCFQGAGRAADGVDVEEVRRAGSGTMPVFGPHAVTVPGAVSTWAAMHRHAGRLPWDALFEPAREAAEGGFAVGARLHRAIEESEDRILADPGLRALLLAEGLPLATGARLRQPELAATLASIAEDGAATAYGGRVADHLVAFLEAAGSALSRADFRQHRCETGAPLESVWSGHRLWTAPPPSQGLVLFRILAAMDRSDDDHAWLGRDAGLLAAAFAEETRYRETHLADPAGAGPPNGDTVAVVAADDAGEFVSLIFSLFYRFGAGLRDPRTGVIFHNRGAGFTVDQGAPNCLGPRRRPPHSLMPLLVADEHGLLGAHGTMGGYGQPQIHAQLLLRLSGGLGSQKAVAAPRFVVGRPDDGGPLRVAVEMSFPGSSVAALRRSGLPVERCADGDSEVGHAQLVRRLPDGELDIGTDPRADGRHL